MVAYETAFYKDIIVSPYEILWYDKTLKPLVNEAKHCSGTAFSLVPYNFTLDFFSFFHFCDQSKTITSKVSHLRDQKYLFGHEKTKEEEEKEEKENRRERPGIPVLKRLLRKEGVEQDDEEE
jgi:hypothetical protein